MHSVLVTRPRPAADEFASALRREGFSVYLAPMTEYVDVAADFSDLAAYQAVIFSSAQAVRVFSTHSHARFLPVLTVGDATALAASRHGFVRVYSAHGDSDDVSSLLRIKAKELGLRKVLHPCSDDTPDDIGRVAEAFGVKVVRRTVYKAHFIDSLPEEVAEALRQGSIDTVTLFSARTAANLVKLMQQKGLRGLSAQLEAVCISERVAVELKGIPWRMVHVARHPHTKSMLEILRERLGAPAPDRRGDERRRGPDRRRRAADRDAQGHIHSAAYTGPDRRQGSRRAHERRQREMVLQEKIRFINRSIATSLLLLAAAVLAAMFLMAPEYMRADSQGAASSLGFMERMWQSARSLQASAEGWFSSAAGAVASGDPQEFLQMLGSFADQTRTAAGAAAVDKSMQTVRALLAAAPSSPQEIGDALAAARQRDPTLDRLLGSVSARNLAAGALLLTLNEFRSNVDHSRPYADDLALLQKFVGGDPEMSQAIARLAPYAEKGALGREALEDELNGLATDIISAKIQGRDVSVKDQALQRFHNLVQLGRLADMKGNAPDVVLARAQLRMKQGDAEGAIRELQGLDGTVAQSAAPWVKDASGYVTAERSSDALVRGILSSLSEDTGVPLKNVFSQQDGAGAVTSP